LVMEINTGGLRKDCKEQYPSEIIINEMYSLDIPILLGSDAHNPDVIAWKFEKIIKMLKRIGYNQLAHFNKRKLTFIEI
ncbi:MAG: histidinol phosphate phosphatase, partial [Candidatus Hodarchaeota archaeon]